MKLVIANWKMNPVTLKEAKQLLRESVAAASKLKNIKLVICPPFVWLQELSKLIRKPFELGAQNVAWADKGAFTGEISPVMLKQVKCSWVIVGHSERRGYLHEYDQMINKKLLKALHSGLKVILAVGERKREGSHRIVDIILETQLKAALQGLKSKYLRNLVVAYEPVWALSTSGTGQIETPDDALQATLLVRKVIARQFGPSQVSRFKVLYGGSVDKHNVASFVNQDGIDGVLVGGASLNAKGFSELLKQVK